MYRLSRRLLSYTIMSSHEVKHNTRTKEFYITLGNGKLWFELLYTTIQFVLINMALHNPAWDIFPFIFRSHLWMRFSIYLPVGTYFLRPVGKNFYCSFLNFRLFPQNPAGIVSSIGGSE